MNPDEISDQILYGLAPHDWVVFPPPKYPKIAFILYSLYIIFMCPLLCTVYFGFMFMALGQTALIQSSFWPMYTTYPILALIALGTPFFLIWLVWQLEKQDRDVLLVLLPNGFAQYKPWSNKNKRHSQVIEYKNVEAMTCKVKRGSIVLTIQKKSGDHEQVFITWKYGGASPKATHVKIAQQLLDGYAAFKTRT